MKIIKTVLIDIISMLFMTLFLYTGISKLMDYTVFKEQLAESPILATVSPFIAITLPLAEILTAVVLLLPRWRLIGLYISLALMTMFTIYIILILSFSNTLPCSCGGILAQLSWPQHLVFNGIFIAMGITGIKLEKKYTDNSESGIEISESTLSNNKQLKI